MSTTKRPTVGDLVRILPVAIDDGWFGGLAVVTDTDMIWDRMAQEELQELELLWSVDGAVGWIPAEHVEIVNNLEDSARVTNAPVG